MVIDLPENKKQIQNLYENFFQKLNANNTMEGISLLQEGNELNSKTITNTNTNTNSQTKISTKNRLQIKTSEKLSEKIKEKEQYTLIDFPEKGFINNNPVPNQINTIGTDIYPSKSNMNEKKTDAEIEARKKN